VAILGGGAHLPTVLRVGPYRFFFYSNERGEPPHIHVRRDRQLAKFWLEPVSLAESTNFPAHELRQVELLVVAHQPEFLQAWHEHIG
jgi:hypothetical protein